HVRELDRVRVRAELLAQHLDPLARDHHERRLVRLERVAYERRRPLDEAAVAAVQERTMLEPVGQHCASVEKSMVSVERSGAPEYRSARARIGAQQPFARGDRHTSDWS